MYVLSANLPVRHAFSTRLGGTSEGPFDSLNLGRSVGDELARVEENERRLLGAFGWNPEQMATVHQVHGDTVVVFERASRSVVEADGLITRTPGVALAVRTADCAPILLYAPDVPAVGAIHAGWRGALLSIGARGVEAMTREYGAGPGSMYAAIGPAIGPCCYQVDEALARRFEDRFGGAVTRWGGEKPTLDIAEASRLALLEAGLKAERVERLGFCTSCDKLRFFSHRRDAGKTGRMVGVVSL